jgi:3-hydroxybutyryl-CoA dehydrogenase
MHWFNPAPAMKLVEIVPTVLSADDVVATVREVAVNAKKVPVRCGDRAGFIVNALLFPYLNDAVRMLEQHYATADDIDAAMKVGCGHPMGPFELMDVVGLDVTLAIQETLSASPVTPPRRSWSTWCGRAISGVRQSAGSATTRDDESECNTLE